MALVTCYAALALDIDGGGRVRQACGGLAEGLEGTHRPQAARAARGKAGRLGAWSATVRLFAAANFENLVEVSFEHDRDAPSLFATPDPVRSVQALELRFNAQVKPGRTLLFLDEKRLDFGLRLCSSPPCIVDSRSGGPPNPSPFRLLSLPFYLVGQIRRLVCQAS